MVDPPLSKPPRPTKPRSTERSYDASTDQAALYRAQLRRLD
ncbi:MAG TPA: hypothetical protein VEB21_21425 [Terriglobales bacterium]|nr:hypothetical protein [Terriglobales bacterium]